MVALKHPLPDHGLPAGAQGAVHPVHPHGTLLVELCGGTEGLPALLDVPGADVEVVWRHWNRGVPG